MPAGSPALNEDNPIAIDYYRHADQQPKQAALKIYHFGSAGRAVAARANPGEYGFQRHQRAHFRGGRSRRGTVYVHDMELENTFGQSR